MELLIPEEYQHLYVQDPNYPIRLFPDPILRQKCAPVTKITKKHQELFDKMIKWCDQYNAGGLAAPQVGLAERFFVMCLHDMKPMIFINPVIISMEGEVLDPNMCMSMPEFYGEVPRAEKIKMRALDRKGKSVTYDFKGRIAGVIQHEYDHLDGILFFEKADPSTIQWGRPDTY